MAKRLTFPERSTRPMQRTSGPWQWGQASGGKAAVAGRGVGLGAKRSGEAAKAARARGTRWWRQLLPSRP